MFVQEAHEVNPGDDFDFDWTQTPGNKQLEQALREVRNHMLKEKLQNGKPVAYRSSGWSCHPRIHANDLLFQARQQRNQRA